MEINLATKEDLEAMEFRLTELIKVLLSQKKVERGLLSLKEASKFLGNMAEQTLRIKACNGEIASHKAGGLKFSIEDLQAYVKATRRRSNDELLAKRNMT